MTQSLAQTKTLIPTVSCSESASDEALPNYPKAADDSELDAMTPEQEIKALKDYRTEQFVWAVQSSGAFAREKMKRAATSKCLQDLRGRGLIN